MPDLRNLVHAPSSIETLVGDDSPALTRCWSSRLRFPILTRVPCSVLKRDRKGEKKTPGGRLLNDHVRVWAEAKVAAGVSESECILPFLARAPKAVECNMCSKCIYPGDKVQCSKSGCQLVFHKSCVKKSKSCGKKSNGPPSIEAFKCPQHVCFICKMKNPWRCVRCTMAAHSKGKCAPWPDDVIYLMNRQKQAICWRHSSDWRLEKEDCFI